MAANDLLIIGQQAARAKAVPILYAENPYSYPVIAFELSAITSSRPPYMSGLEAIPYPQGVNYIKSISAKLEILLTWAKAGHTLVIILDDLPKFNFMDERGMRQEFKAESFGMFATLGLLEATGDNAEVAAKFSLLGELAPLISYKFIIESRLEPVFFASAAKRGNEKSIAVRANLNAGNVYFVPPLSKAAGDQRARYYSSFAEITDAIPVEAPPDWIHDYVTIAESLANAEIAECQSKINLLANEIGKQNEIVSALQADKELFHSHDDVFVHAVIRALKEIGFLAVPGPPYRADVLATDGKIVLAIEAKGLEGSAKERDFRQAVQWKAEVEATITSDASDLKLNPDYARYAECLRELGVAVHQAELTTECRAVVIIGGFRQTPIKERNSPDFPDAVSKVITRSHGTGASGLTLFEIILQSRQTPEIKNSLRAKFFEDGVVKSSAWQKFLNEPVSDQIA